jgi:iron complex transport system substrate-binding protein
MKKLGFAIFLSIAAFSSVVGVWPPTAPSKGSRVHQNFDIHSPDIDSAEAAPHRVAMLFPLLLAYATVDEGVENICCVMKFDKFVAENSLLGRVYPRVSSLSLCSNNFQPDVEKLMSLNPDAVFVLPGYARPFANMGISGISEIIFNPNEHERDDARIWRLVGHVAHKERRAADLMNDLYRELDTFRELAPDAGAPLLRVLPVVSIRMDAWSIGRRNFFLNNIMTRAGGENPARDQNFSGEINIEQMMLLDPDVIILVPSVLASTTPGTFYNDPIWRQIRAVRDKRVYLMPATTSYNQPVDERLILNWMAEIFRPEVMPRRARGLYREVYRAVYNFDLSDEEIDNALFLNENSVSAGYERFFRS